MNLSEYQELRIMKSNYQNIIREWNNYGKSISKRVFPSLRAKASELAASVTRTSYDLGLYTETPAFGSELCVVVLVVVEAFSSSLTHRTLGFDIKGLGRSRGVEKKKLGSEVKLLVRKRGRFGQRVLWAKAMVDTAIDGHCRERERERERLEGK